MNKFSFGAFFKTLGVAVLAGAANAAAQSASNSGAEGPSYTSIGKSAGVGAILAAIAYLLQSPLIQNHQAQTRQNPTPAEPPAA